MATSGSVLVLGLLILGWVLRGYPGESPGRTYRGPDFEARLGRLILGQVRQQHTSTVAALDTETRRYISQRDSLKLRELAREVETRTVIPDRRRRAADIYRWAAEFGDVESMYRLGLYFARDAQGIDSPEASIVWLNKAATQGSTRALYALAVLNRRASSAILGDDLRSQFLAKAFSLGDVEALYLNAQHFLSTGDYKSAIPLLSQAARKGSMFAEMATIRLLESRRYLPEAPSERRRLTILGYVLGLSSETPLLVADNPISDSEVASVCEQLNSWRSRGEGLACVTIVRLALAADDLSPADLQPLQAIAMTAFEAGVPEAAFFLAILAADQGELNSARRWIEVGDTAGDWRSAFAQAVLKQHRDAVMYALSMAFVAQQIDYQNFRLLQADSKKRLVPLALSIPPPVIPPDVAIRPEDAVVSVSFMVGTNGEVFNLDVSPCADSRIAAAVRATVAKWRFRPGVLNGKTVPMALSVPITLQSKSFADAPHIPPF